MILEAKKLEEAHPFVYLAKIKSQKKPYVIYIRK
jgi:hypothetical protein